MSWGIAGFLSAVFAALVAVLGKIGLKEVDSTLATTVRAVIMATFLLLMSLFLGKLKGIETLSGKPLLFIALSGVAGAISWLFYFYALRTGPAGAVSALDRLSIVFVVIFAAIFLAEGLTWKSVSGSVLVALGAYLITLK